MNWTWNVRSNDGAMNGLEFAKQALALKPDLKILLTSGYPEQAYKEHGQREENIPLLSKPYRKQDLARKIREILKRP